MQRAARMVVALLIVAPLLFDSSGVRGSGFLVAQFGGEVGHPATDHPTARYFNPAGLARGHGTRLYLEGIFAYHTASYTRPSAAIDHPGVGTPAEATSANAGKASLANPVAAPFFGVVSDLGVRNLG